MTKQQAHSPNSPSPTDPAVDSPAAVNQVTLTGRVAAPGEDRELPSGDHVVSLRVVVDRPKRVPGGSTAKVDTIDVACWSAATRRVAQRARKGDTVRVDGALRRRFWKAGGAVASRYEVEAQTIRNESTRSGRVRAASE